MSFLLYYGFLCSVVEGAESEVFLHVQTSGLTMVEKPTYLDQISLGLLMWFLQSLPHPQSCVIRTQIQLSPVMQ